MAEEHWNDGSSQEENHIREEAPTVGNNGSQSAQDMSARQSSERAEEVLDEFSRRVSGWRLWLSVQTMVLYYRAREEVEDIVAEAQQIRHRRDTANTPTKSADDQPVGIVAGVGPTFSRRLVDGGIRTVVEDIVAEAQQIRQRRNTTDIPANSTDDLTSPPDTPTGSADTQPVGAVPGIGPTFSRRLVDGGIRTVEDLASAQPEEVARLLGTGEERAIGLINEARRLRPIGDSDLA
jgi:Helix-hairpin-helix domain